MSIGDEDEDEWKRVRSEPLADIPDTDADELPDLPDDESPGVNVLPEMDFSGGDDDDDAPSSGGMKNALERARLGGGRDNFGVLDRLEPAVRKMKPGEPMVDWSKMEALPRDPSKDRGFEVLAKSAAGGNAPPPLGDSVTPEPEQDDPTWKMHSPTPQASFAKYVATGEKPKADPRSEALANMQSIAGRKYAPSPGLSDEAIAKAKGEHKQKVAHDDLSRAITDWLYRRPHTTTPDEDESGNMLARRRAEQSDFERGKSQELSAQAALVKALTGKAPPAITPYQLEQIKRNAMLDERARARYEEEKTRHTDERKEDNEYRDRAHADSEADRAASLRLSEAQFAALQREREDAAAQKLGDKLGDTTDFDSQYNRLMQLAEENGGKLPGLGMAEGIRQQPGIVGSVAQAVSPSTPQAIESRKLLRQLGQGYAHKISGAGVSNQERAQLNAATVDVENGDPEVAMRGLQTLKRMYDAKKAVTKAGFRPDTVKRVEGAMGGGPPQQATQKPAGIPDKAKFVNGKWMWRGPNGVEVRDEEGH